VRNRIVIGLGYIVFGLLSLGSLFILLRALQGMDIGRGTPSYDAGLYAYAIGLACVTAFAGRSEFKWQKSLGLGNQKLVPRGTKEPDQESANKPKR
jgi:hypothetical protein